MYGTISWRTMLKRTTHYGMNTLRRLPRLTNVWWMNGIRLLMFSSYMLVISCYLYDELATYHQIEHRLRFSSPSWPLLSSKLLPNFDAVRPISLMIFSLQSIISRSLNLTIFPSHLSILCPILISPKPTTMPPFSRMHSSVLVYHYPSSYRC